MHTLCLPFLWNGEVAMQQLLLADQKLRLLCCYRLSCLQQLWRHYSKSQLSVTYLHTFLFGTGLSAHPPVMSMTGALCPSSSPPTEYPAAVSATQHKHFQHLQTVAVMVSSID